MSKHVKVIDKTDSVKKVVTSGANINKQVPGMNNSIIPLVSNK